MIGSQRARVRPRVVAIDSGEQFLLEDEVRRLVETGQRGVVQLYGGPGSGKSTALAHLAAVLEDCQDIAFVDDAKFRENPDWSEKRLVVCSTENTIINGPVSSCRQQIFTHLLVARDLRSCRFDQWPRKTLLQVECGPAIP